MYLKKLWEEMGIDLGARVLMRVLGLKYSENTLKNLKKPSSYFIRLEVNFTKTPNLNRKLPENHSTIDAQHRRSVGETTPRRWGPVVSPTTLKTLGHMDPSTPPIDKPFPYLLGVVWGSRLPLPGFKLGSSY